MPTKRAIAGSINILKKKEEVIIMKKKLYLLLALVLAVASLTACGSSDKKDDSKKAESKGTLKVAASATPHAEILEEAKKILKDKGWDLQVQVFDDYVQPNNVVESGDFDANYFQHIPYLEQFNKEKGTHLVNAGGIHYEPFGIYPGTKKDLKDIAKVTRLQFLMTQQMKQERFYYYRIMA